MVTEMKIKELKQLIENLDDDVEVITRACNLELRGVKVKAGAMISNYNIENVNFRDSFDGTEYEKEVYFHSENGEKTLIIYG